MNLMTSGITKLFVVSMYNSVILKTAERTNNRENLLDPGIRVFGVLDSVDLQAPEGTVIQRRPRPSADRRIAIVSPAVDAVLAPHLGVAPQRWPVPVVL